ncbi:MAG: hypothetical protein IIC03_03220 [Proteobacteria bacterium]|nr:hypothetical protein [Pseudomonadota bacterium]
MVKETDSRDTSPEEFPQTTPRDMYATSDIRFVMLTIGELTTKVDSLISSVDNHGEKIDDLRHKVSFVKGAMWVIGGVLAILSIAAIWYFSGKLSITLTPTS